MFNKINLSYLNRFKVFFTNIGKNDLLLGRWKINKNNNKYMDWGTIDNCYTSQIK
jgi:hypothetical protein